MGFGVAFAVGFAAGIGSGTAIGIASGREQARSELQAHIEQNEIAILDRLGRPIKIDDFLEVANGKSADFQNKKWLVAVLILGIAMAVSAVIYYLQ